MKLTVTLQAKIALASVILVVLTALSPALPGQATLSGTTFDASNGNMHPTAAGTIDWSNITATTSVGVDTPSGSSDNAFGQGTKENGSTVTIVDGSIPPNKNDLTRFYVNSQTINNQTFLYLGWERAVNIGSADLDFELNQHPTAGWTANTTGSLTINRTVGDLLVLYNFQGSGTPSIYLARWTGSAWSAATQVSSANSEGSVNTATISDPFTNANLTTGLFGEASINLTGAGIFQAGVCTSFGSAFTKSRSSNSFTAELKDFIAPVPVVVSNCGSLVVHKTDLNSNTLAGATFVVQPGSNASSTSITSTTMTEFAPGYFCADNLVQGTHTVTETVAPTGYDLSNPNHQQATVSSISTCSVRESGNYTGTVDLTFQNSPQLGAIRINKTSVKGNTPLDGATFSLTGPNGYNTTGITTTNGTTCIGNLPLGTYYASETAAPTGYHLDSTAAQTVTLTQDSSCTSAEGTASFTDTPLSTLTLTFHSLAGSTVTQGSVTCTPTGTLATQPVTLTDSQSVTTTNLLPGNYVCTVNVDP